MNQHSGYLVIKKRSCCFYYGGCLLFVLFSLLSEEAASFLSNASVHFSSVQSLSHVRLFAITRIATRQASLYITISRSSLNPFPSSQGCHPAISSSVVPFSSCPTIPPSIRVFPMSQLFAWGGQSTGVSALAPFPQKKSQGWSSLEWTGWNSLQSKRLSRVFSNTTVQKHQFFEAQLSSQSNSHIHTWPLENHSLD